MKDEIPQSVIDSHVKNAANARAEKVKQESSEENKGSINYYHSLHFGVRFFDVTRRKFGFTPTHHSAQQN